MRSDQIYLESGRTLELIQIADSIFQTVLLMCLPGAEVNNLSVYQGNDKILRKATLGKMISILHERVEMTEQFESIINNYLNMRNSFVHSWDEIDDWDSDESAIKFLCDLQSHAIWILNVMGAILKSWSEQIELDIPQPDISDIDVKNYWDDVGGKWMDFVYSGIKKIKHET